MSGWEHCTVPDGSGQDYACDVVAEATGEPPPRAADLYRQPTTVFAPVGRRVRVLVWRERETK